MRVALLALMVLAGCASHKVWVRPGASQQDFAMDSGQCKAQAFSVPNAPMMQVAVVYNSCMQGKGWHTQDAQ